MQNFVLAHFVSTMRLLDQEISICGVKAQAPLRCYLSDDDKSRLGNLLKYADDLFKRMGLVRAPDRLSRLTRSMKIGADYQSVFSELNVLKEAVEDDIKLERFYHYSNTLAELPINYRRDWASTLAAFPGKGVEFEVRSGVDCYALGHPTAAIFHFMRAVEYALRATARRLRVTLPQGRSVEWSEWRAVLTAMRRKVEAANQASRGKRKADELEFYSGALSHFEGFKDMFRDNVMHVRREYTEREAEMAMRHARDFMNKLAMRLVSKRRHIEAPAS